MNEIKKKVETLKLKYTGYVIKYRVNELPMAQSVTNEGWELL